MNTIRALRERLRLNRKDFSALLKVSPESIERYEAEPPEDKLHLMMDVATEHGFSDLAETLEFALQDRYGLKPKNLSDRERAEIMMALKASVAKANTQLGVYKDPRVQALARLDEGITMILRSIEALTKSVEEFRDALAGEAGSTAITDPLSEKTEGFFEDQQTLGKDAGSLSKNKRRSG